MVCGENVRSNIGRKTFSNYIDDSIASSEDELCTQGDTRPLFIWRRDNFIGHYLWSCLIGESTPLSWQRFSNHRRITHDSAIYFRSGFQHLLTRPCHRDSGVIFCSLLVGSLMKIKLILLSMLMTFMLGIESPYLKVNELKWLSFIRSFKRLNLFLIHSFKLYPTLLNRLLDCYFRWLTSLFCWQTHSGLSWGLWAVWLLSLR